MFAVKTRKLVALFSGAVIFTALLWLISKQIFAPQGESSAKVFAAQGAKIFVQLEMSPLERRDNIRDALDAAEIIEGASLATEQQQKSLRQVAADFLWFYYGVDSPHPYIQWRRDTGFVFRDRTEMVKEERADVAYTYYTGKNLTPELTDEELFAQMWNGLRSSSAGANRAIAITSDPSGLIIAFKQFTASDMNAPVFLSAKIPAELWHGGRAQSSRRWWKPPTDLDTVMLAPNQALGGYVGVVLQFGNGTRRPLMLCFFWDPASSAWRLIGVTCMNFDSQDVFGLEF